MTAVAAAVARLTARSLLAILFPTLDTLAQFPDVRELAGETGEDRKEFQRPMRRISSATFHLSVGWWQGPPSNSPETAVAFGPDDFRGKILLRLPVPRAVDDAREPRLPRFPDTECFALVLSWETPDPA